MSLAVHALLKSGVRLSFRFYDALLIKRIELDGSENSLLINLQAYFGRVGRHLGFSICGGLERGDFRRESRD